MDLKYVAEFDQLRWEIDVDAYRFYECYLEENQPEFRKWLFENLQHRVYLWSGMLNADHGVSNWGAIRQPSLWKFYLIFEDPNDEEIFALRYLGNVCLRQHKNGTEAYHKRKANPDA